MHRITTALLCCLAAVAAPAAPAPTPRPWFTGWYRPADPKGDCQFDRKGDRLALTVPGGPHRLDAEGGHRNVPRLLRDAEGDFVAAVRVTGEFRSAARAGAGLLLSDGTAFVAVERLAAPPGPGRRRCRLYFERCRPGERDNLGSWTVGPEAEGPLYLRLSRRGDRVWGEYSLDGKTWWAVHSWRDAKLPRKVRVGVFAESAAPGTFQVRFDGFELSRRKK
jgi:hypothetical protein